MVTAERIFNTYFPFRFANHVRCTRSQTSTHYLDVFFGDRYEFVRRAIDGVGGGGGWVMRVEVLVIVWLTGGLIKVVKYDGDEDDGK